MWAIIGYLRGYDIDQTAADYEVPRAAVEAALAYYAQHRATIDAWLTLNDAAFQLDHNVPARRRWLLHAAGHDVIAAREQKMARSSRRERPGCVRGLTTSRGRSPSQMDG